MVMATLALFTAGFEQCKFAVEVFNNKTSWSSML